MAEAKMTVEVSMEPSAQTVAASKMILEMWVNADKRRNILVKEQSTCNGPEIYLDLVREPNESQTETN